MTKEEDNEIIDPVAYELDPETLKAVERLIRGYSDASPSKPSGELTDYQIGRRDAYSAMLATLYKWLDEIEQDSNCESDD